ncbi:MAG: NUDIX hydrolase [Deltaproteobacteria bacterium]|nr:NUDIX hydrolase [Deltaproteobacteria bacterium]
MVYDQKGDQVHYLVVSAKKDPDCLIFPMGHVEPGETLEETAAREAQEEAGVEVKIEQNLGFFFYEQDDTIFQTDIFLASLISDGPSSESREKRWIQPEDLDQLNMFREGKRFIRDLNIQ